MRASHIIIFICFISASLFSQENEDEVDLKYLEDQFYVGLTYNFILNKPDPVDQRNLSYGLQGGFIKDIPLNSQRNVAIGIGLGYAVNSYYSNLSIQKLDNSFEYSILESDIGLKRNKLETHLLEFPLEFRWRNSTPEEYKFWRIYSGIKFSYILGSRSKIVTDTGKESFYFTDTDNFQYGLMVNFGYNTFNIHAYYALNNLFKDGLTLDTGEDLTFTPLRIGLIFYIL